MAYLFEAFAYNVIFLCSVLPTLGRGVFAIPYFALFNLTWCLAIWSFVQAHTTDPGVVPNRWLDFVHAVGEDLPITPPRQEFQPGKATMCRRCAVPRPERAHHCQFCGICVLRYDHHCPWINNCVGLNNHKYFLLVMFYSWLASVIGLITSAPEFLRCLEALVGMKDRSNWEAQGLSTLMIVCFLIFVLLAFLVVLLVSMLLHTYIPWATQNLTTVEETYANMANPFDLGSKTANVSQIFGSFGPDWFFPVKPFVPQTDGIYFPRVGEDLPSTILWSGSSHQREMANQESPMAAREVSRTSSAADAAYDSEVQLDKLWRARYHVGRRQPRQQNGSSSTLNRSWKPVCCSRVSNRGENDDFDGM